MDRTFMQLALEAAARAAERDEVPVGAVLTIEDRVIVVAHNERELTNDPTAHAELLAMRRAAKLLGRWRLHDATVYVTLEPCAMCAGALVNARVKRLVYGADDPKAGGVRSLYRITEDARLNHRVDVVAGLEAEACGDLLRKYFRNKRSKRDAAARK